MNEVSGRQRLDQALVARGLAESRAKAQALVAAGVVSVGGRRAAKASLTVGPHDDIDVAEDPCPWVSRAALKLLHALDAFGLAPHGTALDLGASTGGFTEVLLARGAAEVVALDVGHGQLHPRLVSDPRVHLLEGVNARDLAAAGLQPPDWVTADLSFISLRLALPPALALAEPGARLVALVKPQFELGREALSKGGIVRDEAARRAAAEAAAEMVEAHGWTRIGLTESPIAGGDGNIEWLLAARKPG